MSLELNFSSMAQNIPLGFFELKLWAVVAPAVRQMFQSHSVTVTWMGAQVAYWVQIPVHRAMKNLRNGLLTTGKRPAFCQTM